MSQAARTSSSRRTRSAHVLLLSAALAGLVLLLPSRDATAANLNFRRGDVDGNGKLEMADAVRTFGFLFLGNPTSLGCMDAADTNDSGKVDLSDGVATLNFMFTGGAAPPSPGHINCGPDTTAVPDTLTCDESPNCAPAPTPPSAPTGVSATPGNAQVTVDWANNPEGDIAGYNIYRSTTAGSGHTKLNGSLLTQSLYTDNAVTNGTRYYYKVTAVDIDSLESLQSAEVNAMPVQPPSGNLKDIGHLLNRITHGPNEAAIDDVEALGIPGYITQQLNPDGIDESGNTALNTRVNALFNTVVPSKDTPLLPQGSVLRYLKGTQAPPAGWDEAAFDDSTWTLGVSGIGYGDGDDATILDDMQQEGADPGYMSVFVRLRFNADPATVDRLVLSVLFDDGYVAYLNGTEVHREGLSGTPPPFNAAATSHDANGFEEVDITARKNLLVDGTNVLAVQAHNANITSSDLSMHPIVINREILAGPTIRQIKSINHLQQLTHVRAVYSEKQLQSVLAEFWDNHFTTDYDKVAEYLDMLQNADGSDAMSPAQAALEAANLKYQDFQFYTDHAFNFEDMFLYHASNPSMLIYLDNVENIKGGPNENFAREILELFGFGVNNRYTQKDIEQLALCFTGWNVCKIGRDEIPSFPDSVNNPPANCGVQYTDTVILAKGSGWKYFKGTAEPSPGAGGEATIDWTKLGFVDTAWLNGSTGIGYGDGDDATVLNDMQGNYRTVYLRRSFTLTQAQIESPDPILLSVDYDDGYVAYLNGVEVARSENMEDYGSPPRFDQGTSGELHEVSAGTEYRSLNSFRSVMVAGTNVLAIQVHNGNLDSSDLSMIPEIRSRKILGGTDNGDPNGVFTFYFDPAKHDTTAKVLFQGTPQQINIPAGRTGAAGLRDALDPVKAMVTHPSTKEFICIKLIQKFVSDDITIQNFRDGSAPLALRSLLADCIAAWGAKGDIRAVMNVILDPVDQANEFWADAYYRNKIRTPTELVNASARVLSANLNGVDLAGVVASMDWLVFTRDEPDGNEEDYSRSTGQLRDTIDYVQSLSENKDADYSWGTLSYLDSRGLDTAQEIVDHFSDIMFHGTLTAEEEARLLEFLTTDANYAPKALVRAQSTDFQTRVQELLGLMFSLPQWQFQ